MSLHPAPEPCPTDCDLPDGRRAFLKEGLWALAALTAIGATAGPLDALTRVYATGAVRDGTVRYPLPTADGATIDAPNKVILVRYAGAIHAFSLLCPHRQTQVEWQPSASRFYCPKHKSTFRPEGTLIQGKAERNLDRLAVRIDGTEVVVETEPTIRSDRAADAWSAAKATL